MQRAELEELLTKAKDLLKSEVPPITYNTWLKPMEIDSIDHSTITLRVATVVHKDMVRRYLDLLKNTFSYLTNIDYDIKLISNDELSEAGISVGNNNSDTHVPISNNYQKSHLKYELTFDNFVVGENNRFAHAAALAVSEAPGTAYNPLFLYGGPGLGKTHLMHAVGNEILKHNKDMNILYVPAEEFNNNLIAGIKEGTMENFRNKYRYVDVLLIDDIQFIAGKDSNQEEFFHTFNTLHDAGKQIILSSDKPPRDIQKLEERLKTRFSWGLTADISMPTYETRMAILQKKAQLENIIIDNEILSNIALKVDTNIRDLEGAFKKLVALSKMKNLPFSLELSEEAISDVIAQQNKVISIDYIQEIVAKFFHITVADLKGSRRSSEVVFPRQIAMYLCKNVAQISYPKIGQAFGKRDHSTVMHACDKIETDIKEKPNVKQIVDTVQNSIFSDKSI